MWGLDCAGGALVEVKHSPRGELYGFPATRMYRMYGVRWRDPADEWLQLALPGVQCFFHSCTPLEYAGRLTCWFPLGFQRRVPAVLIMKWN